MVLEAEEKRVNINASQLTAMYCCTRFWLSLLKDGRKVIFSVNEKMICLFLQFLMSLDGKIVPNGYV